MELAVMLMVIAALLVMVAGGLILPAKPVPVPIRVREDFDSESGWELL